MADRGNLKLTTSREKGVQFMQPHATPTSNASLPIQTYSQVVKGQQRGQPSTSSLQNLDNHIFQADKGSISAQQHLDSLLEPNPAQLKTPCLLQGTPTLHFNLAEQSQMVSKLKYVLVGKFSHGRPAWSSVQSFFTGLKLSGPYNLSIFDHKHLYIECSNKCDFNHIWLRLFWSIDGYVMRVFKWGPEFSSSIESPVAPVWIRLEGLPLYMFDEMPLLNISNVIGKPIKIDPRNLNRSMLNSARVCVELDVSKPLIDSVKVDFVEEKTCTVVDGFWVQVVYDLVPPYCASCCHIGHCQDKCKRSVAPGMVVETHKKRAGKELVPQSESCLIPQAAPSKQQWQPIIRKNQESNIRDEAKQVTHQVTSISNSYNLLTENVCDDRAVNTTVDVENAAQNGSSGSNSNLAIMEGSKGTQDQKHEMVSTVPTMSELQGTNAPDLQQQSSKKKAPNEQIFDVPGRKCYMSNGEQKRSGELKSDMVASTHLTSSSTQEKLETLQSPEPVHYNDTITGQATEEVATQEKTAALQAELVTKLFEQSAELNKQHTEESGVEKGTGIQIELADKMQKEFDTGEQKEIQVGAKKKDNKQTIYLVEKVTPQPAAVNLEFSAECSNSELGKLETTLDQTTPCKGDNKQTSEDTKQTWTDECEEHTDGKEQDIHHSVLKQHRHPKAHSVVEFVGLDVCSVLAAREGTSTAAKAAATLSPDATSPKQTVGVDLHLQNTPYTPYSSATQQRNKDGEVSTNPIEKTVEHNDDLAQQNPSPQEWQVVGKKNTKTKGVVTRSQTKNAWADKVEDEQVEDQTPISTKEQTGNKATRSRRQLHRLMMRLSHRINNMSLKHVMRSELLAEMAALKEEEDSLLR